MSEMEAPGRRGRPVAKLEDGVKEYMHERNADRREWFEQAITEWVDRERWRHLYHGHPFGGTTQRE